LSQFETPKIRSCAVFQVVYSLLPILSASSPRLRGLDAVPGAEARAQSSHWILSHPTNTHRKNEERSAITMALIKLNFARLSVQEKIALVRRIVTKMTDNPHFPNPQPPLATITAGVDGLEQSESDAQIARQEAKAKTTTRNNREDALGQLMTQAVGYVTAIAGGDEEIIQSAGMDVRATPATAAAPGQPLALGATAGDHDGSMDLSWDPIVEAASYVIEMSPDPPTATSWKHMGVSTKSTFTVTGLPSGTRVWFRVAALNANGQSPWSDPATKIVP
jgi:hypothetical protein